MKTANIILTAFSPNFNHIASNRISKIAKFLSKKEDVFIVGGKPNYVKDNNSADIGSATLYEIVGCSKNKNNTLAEQQAGNGRLQMLKKFLGPLIMFFIPMSSGGAILYNPEEFEDKVACLIEENSGKKIRIITSYNPWFIIKLGRRIKKKYNVEWLIDYRDLPFCNAGEPITYLPIFKYYVSKTAKESDGVLCVSREIERKIENLAAGKARYYPNGYDKDEFFQNDTSISSDRELSIRYAGRFYPDANRDLHAFCKMLRAIYDYGFTDWVFEYAGPQANYVSEIFKKFYLLDKLIIHGILSRRASLNFQSEAGVLLSLTYTGDSDNVNGDGIITGKIFEYIMSNRPIINVCTLNWELRELVESNEMNICLGVQDFDKLRNYLLDRQYLNNTSYNSYLLEEYNHEFLVSKIQSDDFK